MHKFIHILVVITLCIHAERRSHAQENAATLTLNAFLLNLKKTHPTPAKAQVDIDIQNRIKAGLAAGEDWTILSQPGYYYEEPVVLSPFQPKSHEVTTFDLGLSRPVWNTGGRVGGSWRYSLTNRDIDDIALGTSPSGLDTGPTEIHEQRLFLNYTHPLLRNRGGIQDTLPIRLQNSRIEISKVQTAETSERFYLDASTRYLNWALQEELKRIAEERLELAKEQRIHQEKKHALNLVEKVDVLRATASELTAKHTLALAHNAWNASQKNLAELSADARLLQQHPAHDIYTRPKIPALDKKAIDSSSRLLRAHDLRIKQLQDEKVATENTIRPFLDLTLQGGLRSGEETFSESMDLELPEAAVHLTFRHPIGAHAANENLQRIKLEIRRENASRSETQRHLFSSCSTLESRLQGLSTVLDLNLEQIKTLSEQTTEERRLQKQGRNDLIFVIQAEDQLRNTQLIYAQNAATFQKLLFQLQAELDRFADTVIGP